MSRGVTTAVLVCLALLLCAIPQPAAAEIRFRCSTGDPSMECAFSVEHPGGAGRTNFVLSGAQERALSDSLAGGRYCVVVDRKVATVNYPERAVGCSWTGLVPAVPTQAMSCGPA